MGNPLFSVVIPTYNRSEVLFRCLESLQKQIYKDFEVIVCDDGSGDSTKDVVNEFAGKLDIKYKWEQNWGGPARPRNIGISLAKGHWICFLDSDDWWYPEKLELTSKFVGKYDVLYHSLDEYVNGIRKPMVLRKLGKDVFRDLLVNGNTLPNSSAVVRKELLQRVGNVSEDKGLIALEDYDLWLRISQVTDLFFEIPCSLGAYWLDAANGNISIDKVERMAEKELYVFNRYNSVLKEKELRLGESRIYRLLARYCRLNKNFRCAADYYRRSLKNKMIVWKEDVPLTLNLLRNYLLCLLTGLFVRDRTL